MLYHWYELSHAAVKPARVAADAGRLFFNNPFNPLTHTHFGRHAAAACEVFERTTRRYNKPQFRIDRTVVDGRSVAVCEDVVWRRPFCRLVHFVRDVPAERRARDPRILLVAPMSGHYATLLRGTVEALLPTCEVFITDWQNACDIPLAAGRFDLDDYIDYMRDLFAHFGGDVHVFAVCQPAVPVLAAVSLMEEEDNPAVPLSMILAGGPIDTRVSPTVVNKLAEERGIEWFRRNVITSVPWPNLGYGRMVYPGFLQLTGFMTMNLDRHVNAHKDLFFHLVRGDGDSAEKHREFYDEYLAVMDLTAEFYLQTVDTVFVRHALPKGTMTSRGRAVDLRAIRRVAMLTIEGEKDDITGVGQCAAALDLCSSIPAANKEHFQCPGVGHYGIFNGSRFRSQIAPRIARFVHRHDPRTRGLRDQVLADFDAVAARANTRSYEFAAEAFSFSAANDTAPDRMARKLKGQGLGSKGQSSEPAAGSPLFPHFRIAALAGNLFLDGLFRLPMMLAGVPARPAASAVADRTSDAASSPQ
jgi:poly(3-hydroxybutyrate) depolymerase